MILPFHFPQCNRSIEEEQKRQGYETKMCTTMTTGHCSYPLIGITWCNAALHLVKQALHAVVQVCLLGYVHQSISVGAELLCVVEGEGGG